MARAIMTVKEVFSPSFRYGRTMVRAYSAQWGAKDFCFCLDIVPKKMRSEIKPGSMLIADINLAAKDQWEVNPKDFELPDPDVLAKAEKLFKGP